MASSIELIRILLFRRTSVGATIAEKTGTGFLGLPLVAPIQLTPRRMGKFLVSLGPQHGFQIRFTASPTLSLPESRFQTSFSNERGDQRQEAKGWLALVDYPMAPRRHGYPNCFSYFGLSQASSQPLIANLVACSANLSRAPRVGQADGLFN
jgi:hypothetical protein